MKSRLRTPSRLGMLALGAALVAVAASPASATVLADWPSGGTIPTACPPTSYTPTASGFTMGFTDAVTPQITAWDINGKPSQLIVPPTGVQAKFQLHVTQLCSGVGSASIVVRYTNGGTPTFTTKALTAQGVDAFNSVYGVVQAMTPDSAGRYTVPIAQVGRRYDSFVLDQDYKLVSKVATVSTPSYQLGTWASQTVMVLRATTLTATQTATRVAKGTKVTFSSTLTYATPTGYVVYPGATVLVQTKTGTGSWLTKATLTSNASGVVSYAINPTAQTQVRFTHPGTSTGKFTAAITSAIKSVAVY